MKSALTGTPGVGKTTVSKLLEKKGYNILDLNEFIRENDLIEGEDRERGTFEVDTELLLRAFNREKGEYDIVEGHLSHHLKISPTIVLRCSPEELKNRMEKKRWDQKKIKENTEAEALDIILVEALELCDQVYEIDTTDKNPEKVTECVIEILEKRSDDYTPGSVDWSEDYFFGR